MTEESLASLVEQVVDNRGKTCPTSEAGFPLIATNCVKSDALYPTFEKVRYVNEETYQNWFRGHPIPDDLIFVLKGSPGEVCLTPDPVPFCIAQDMVALRPDPKKVYPPYLFAALRSERIRNDILNMHVGTMIPHFKKGDFDRLFIPIPDKIQQHAIGDAYLKISKKIELNRRMNETLEEMAQALFRDWFVDFGPTRRQIEGATDPAAIMGHAFPAKTAATLARLFPAKLGENGLPEGWEKRELRSVLTLNYGKSLPKTARTPGPYNVYGSGGISGTHNAALTKGPSVIVGRKGTVGSLYWSSDDFFAIDTVFYVTSDHPMVFCHRLLETLGLETMNTDAAVPGLNRDNAYRQEFAFGGEDLINAYAGIGDSLVAKSDANEKENQTLAALRDLLLPKLMSGEIRLKDAEVVAE